MDTVPLTRVTLYKSPHAFIERECAIDERAASYVVHAPRCAVARASLSVKAPRAASTVFDRPLAPPPAADADDDERCYAFEMGAGKGLGEFLGSVIGAEVSLEVAEQGPSV